jgi:hypothetical protein
MIMTPAKGITPAKNILNSAHNAIVFGRRVRILASILAREVPAGAHVLDVGTGDGSIVAALVQQRRDIQIEGIDVLVRPHTQISVRAFDGEHIPLGNNSVLHHTNDPRVLLQESSRVSRRYVLIKDHLREGPSAEVILRMMDWVGNYGHDVVLPYNYLTKNEWRELTLHPNAGLRILGCILFRFQ